MISADSNSSSETYTVSDDSCASDDEDEIDDDSLLEESIELVEERKKQFILPSTNTADDNQSKNDDNLANKNEITIPEMTIVTETNLPEIFDNQIIELNETTHLPSSQNKSCTVPEANDHNNLKDATNTMNLDKPIITDDTSNVIVPAEINPELYLSKVLFEQAVLNEITPNDLNKTFDPFPSDNLIQLSPIQPDLAESAHSPSVQNIESKPATVALVTTAHTLTSTTETTAQNAAFQDDMNDTSPFSVQDSVSDFAKISETQNAANNSECITETQHAQQIQQSVPAPVPELSITELSQTVPAQSSSILESDLAQIRTTVSKLLLSISDQNSGTTNFSNEIVPDETTTVTLEISEIVKSNFLDNNNSASVIIPIEQKLCSEAVEVKSMTGSEVENFENMETPLDEFPKESHKSVEGISNKVDEPGQQAMQFETPRRPAPNFDSRTITRPSKIRTQQLPEATVAPFSKTESKSTTENMIAASAVNTSTASARQLPSSSAVSSAPNHTQSQPLQPLGQQAAVAPQSQVTQQGLPPREERKSAQRVRQRTVTVQSQISLDISSAYNEVKQMNSDDPTTELLRRVQAIVATREKEWTAKNEKLTHLLANEQKRNAPLEQKAAERLLAMNEYEKLLQELVEELKKKNPKEKNYVGESKSMGRPGPERNLSPDDVTQLIKERDQLSEEVNSLETSYSELFRRYEKLRQTSVEIKRNEDSVKSASEEMARRYALLVEKFEMLRRNAEEQLDLANNEIERLIKQHESDTLGLRLKVKHQESKIDSLTTSLEARQKELESMTAIFEEVITKAEANDVAGDVA